MGTKRKKRFFTNHSKSSAMVVSLALHAILAVVALSFVAVTEITKDDQKFESKQVTQPRMPAKKLQVPVKIKKQKRKPKLRQRIVVKTKIRNMPDIKMPEISGIKGGLGAVGGAGLGDAGGVGFFMPEIEIFGVRSKGEKVFIALDSDAYIMRDEVGGKRAYAIIKDELVKIIEGLSSTTLFNLAVFDYGGMVMLFPQMVPATRENTGKVGKWLEPLNAVTETNVGSIGLYGIKTLEKGGSLLHAKDEAIAKGKLKASGARHWYRPAAKAMMDQADTVFILSGWWGVLREADGSTPEWDQDKREKWHKYLKEAQEEHRKENERRAAKGEPEQVIRDTWHLMREYRPEQHAKYYKPMPPWYNYTGKDYAEALHIVRKENAPKLPAKSGLTKREKDRFSLNVVFFAPEDKPGPIGQYEVLAKRCSGGFRIIKGLEAIESSASN